MGYSRSDTSALQIMTLDYTVSNIIYWYEWFQNNADYASDLLPVVWEELTSEQQEIYVEETTTEINNILEEIRWSQATAKAMDVLIENVKQEEGAKNDNAD